MKIVLDTNTLVSAIGWEGPPARIFRACRAGRFDLIISSQLLDELTRVLTYPKLRTIAQHPELPEILRWVHAPEHVVIPKRTVRVVTADPPDNRVLEAAVEGKADVMISGDEHLLGLIVFEGIPILSPAAFCQKWSI